MKQMRVLNKKPFSSSALQKRISLRVSILFFATTLGIGSAMLSPLHSFAADKANKQSKNSKSAAADKTDTDDLQQEQESIPRTFVIDRVIAAVDGEPFTEGDLKRFMATHGEVVPTKLSSTDETTKKYLRDMILARLLEKEAEKAGISVSDDEIEAYMTEIRSQNSVDDQGFDELLESRGLTKDSYKDQVRSEIIKTRIIGSNVRTKINIVDEDIQEYLKEHPEYLPKEGEIHLEQIFISANDPEHRAKLKEIRKRATDGEEFAELAPNNFTDLGYIQLSDLKEELSENLDSPEAGEITKVITNNDGSYLLRVAATGENVDEISDQLKQQIKQAIYQQRFQKVMDDFLNKELPAKYTVEMKL